MMGTIIVEHVNVADLLETWRARVPGMRASRVKVRIEEEGIASTSMGDDKPAVDLLFGMWREREDMSDVDSYVRKLRAPRHNPDGSRNSD